MRVTANGPSAEWPWAGLGSHRRSLPHARPGKVQAMIHFRRGGPMGREVPAPAASAALALASCLGAKESPRQQRVGEPGGAQASCPRKRQGNGYYPIARVSVPAPTPSAVGGAKPGDRAVLGGGGEGGTFCPERAPGDGPGGRVAELKAARQSPRRPANEQSAARRATPLPRDSGSLPGARLRLKRAQ